MNKSSTAYKLHQKSMKYGKGFFAALLSQPIYQMKLSSCDFLNDICDCLISELFKF